VTSFDRPVLSGVEGLRTRDIQASLSRWYREHRRDLPWRRTRDPYAIWIAETMLQQTRSDTVEGYYERFLLRFPTIEALARAPESAVLAVWSGLGYYARARNLRLAARRIVKAHGGEIPKEVATLRTLPGVGRYTAGAVASIAFDTPAPLVDGNVARVLARAFAIPGRLRSARFEAAVWKVAERLVPAEFPSDWNQALMELGATVCTPREPGCNRCPIRRHCGAHATEATSRFPAPARRARMRHVKRASIVIENNGRALLVRREGTRLLRGLWEFPTIDVPAGATAAETAVRELARLGAHRSLVRTESRFVHTIMNQRIEVEIFRAEYRHAPAGHFPDARWFPWPRVAALPLSAAARRISSRVAPDYFRSSGPSLPKR
jgi:A/G-specific adenine glycosylase